MGSAFGDNTHTKVFVSLVLIGTVCSAAASLLMLYIIYRLKKLKKWNGHLLLVTTMTVFTLIYDVTFFPGIINLGDKYFTIFSNCCQLFSGIASSLTSNVIAYITYYVVTKRKSFHIFPNYGKLLAIITLPGIVDCIVYLASFQNNNSDNLADIAILIIYYYLKILSIALNFLLSGLTYREIRRIASGRQLISKHEEALNALSMKLFFYPIIQSISRIGCAWYEFAYSFDNHSGSGFDLNPDHTDNTQFAAQIVMALTMPIASIGYLIIFLIMQPTAYEELLICTGCRTREDIQRQSQQELNHPLGDFESSSDLKRHLPEEDYLESPRDSLHSYESESHLRFSLLQSVDDERSSTSLYSKM